MVSRPAWKQSLAPLFPWGVHPGGEASAPPPTTPVWPRTLGWPIRRLGRSCRPPLPRHHPLLPAPHRRPFQAPRDPSAPASPHFFVSTGPGAIDGSLWAEDGCPREGAAASVQARAGGQCRNHEARPRCRSSAPSPSLRLSSSPSPSRGSTSGYVSIPDGPGLGGRLSPQAIVPFTSITGLAHANAQRAPVAAGRRRAGRRGVRRNRAGLSGGGGGEGGGPSAMRLPCETVTVAKAAPRWRRRTPGADLPEEER